MFCFAHCGKTEKNAEQKLSLNEPSKAKQVHIQISWEYSQIPLKMQIYEPSVGQALDLWTTGSVTDAKPKPFSIPIEDSSFWMSPGSKKQFVLVMKNESDKEIYFFAAPHQALPVEHSFGFKFKCLCVNHAFIVPPKETWYRVVELRLSPEFVGDRLSITHHIIGMSKERMFEFKKGAKQELHNEMD